MPRAARAALASLTATLLVVLAATMALAQDELLDGKLRTGDNVSIGADESVEGDLYLIAGTATVDGSVDGDLTVIGGQVTLNGTVTGDVLAIGGSVIVGGSVDGDVRTSGGQVDLRGETGEDVLAAGGQLTLSSGGSIGGDLMMAGGQAVVAGSVAGSIQGAAGTYDRTGSVGGTEHVVVDETADEPDEPAEDVTGDIFDALRHFVVLLILGALILWLVPRFLIGAETTLRSRPGPSVLWGVITVVGYVVFVVCALIIVILLAILFGLLSIGSLVFIDVVAGLLAIFTVTFGFVLAVGFVADLVVGFALARLVAREPAPAWWQRFGILAAGAAVVVIITALPIIGGIAKLLVALFGLGAIALVVWRAWRPPTPAAAAPTWGQPPIEPAA